MSKHTIQISDDEGKAFKIVVSIPQLALTVFSEVSGNWRALEKGHIRYTQGKALYENNYNPSVANLLLFDSMQSNFHGLRLNDYSSKFGVNDEGMGYIWQPWVLDFKAYRISWVLIE